MLLGRESASRRSEHAPHPPHRSARRTAPGALHHHRRGRRSPIRRLPRPHSHRPRRRPHGHPVGRRPPGAHLLADRRLHLGAGNRRPGRLRDDELALPQPRKRRRHHPRGRRRRPRIGTGTRRRDRLRLTLRLDPARPLPPRNGHHRRRPQVDAVVHGVIERTTPRFVVAKGGITSSDAASKGLEIRRARVIGPMLPGIVSLWSAIDGTAAGIPYIVCAGNVGTDESLAEVVAKLEL